MILKTTINQTMILIRTYEYKKRRENKARQEQPIGLPQILS